MKKSLNRASMYGCIPLICLCLFSWIYKQRTPGNVRFSTLEGEWKKGRHSSRFAFFSLGAAYLVLDGLLCQTVWSKRPQDKTWFYVNSAWNKISLLCRNDFTQESVPSGSALPMFAHCLSLMLIIDSACIKANSRVLNSMCCRSPYLCGLLC